MSIAKIADKYRQIFFNKNNNKKMIPEFGFRLYSESEKCATDTTDTITNDLLQYLAPVANTAAYSLSPSQSVQKFALYPLPCSYNFP